MTITVGFAGYSGSGKTTLIAKLARRLEERGRRVAVIKHDAHGHYKEAAGTDSAAFIDAEASAVVVISPDAVRSYERRAAALDDVLEGLQEAYDVILIEGFKAGGHPKIAVMRTEGQETILTKLAPPPLAIAADPALSFIAGETPVYALDDTDGIARFLLTLGP